MSSVEIELDDELLALVDREVAATGRARSEVIADAVRRQLGPNRLRALLDRVESDTVDDDEAMRIAVAEQDAWRAERDSA